MSRTRMKSLKAINTEINKVRQMLEATEKKHDRLVNLLTQLHKEKEAAEANELYLALKKSKKSFEEVMTFLGR